MTGTSQSRDLTARLARGVIVCPELRQGYCILDLVPIFFSAVFNKWIVMNHVRVRKLDPVPPEKYHKAATCGKPCQRILDGRVQLVSTPDSAFPRAANHPLLILPARSCRPYGRTKGIDPNPQSQQLVDSLIPDSQEKKV